MSNNSKSKNERPKKLPPAKTPEARENQLVAMAVDLAEQQLLDGTATSQVITHFLKLGSTKEKIEKRKRELKIFMQMHWMRCVDILVLLQN